MRDLESVGAINHWANAYDLPQLLARYPG